MLLSLILSTFSSVSLFDHASVKRIINMIIGKCSLWLYHLIKSWSCATFHYECIVHSADTYLVFDSHYSKNIKEIEQERILAVALSFPLIPHYYRICVPELQETENKVQHFAFICKYLSNNHDLLCRIMEGASCYTSRANTNKVMSRQRPDLALHMKKVI